MSVSSILPCKCALAMLAAGMGVISWSAVPVWLLRASHCLYLKML